LKSKKDVWLGTGAWNGDRSPSHYSEKTIGEERSWGSEELVMKCPICGAENPEGQRKYGR
jgi:hypothetical protein